MTVAATEPRRERFYETAAGAFFLDTAPEGIERYLGGRGWLEDGEPVVAAEIAGQGNMNLVVRIRTDRRSFILKQSRPWVERYPQIAAPFDRALVEAEFYRALSQKPAAAFMPQFHWVDAESRILCMEDLGTVRDFSNLYAGAGIGNNELEQLCRFLSLLHGLRSGLANRAMRTLNHFHLFVYPFQADNSLDLDGITPGLAEAARHLQRNCALVEAIAGLGKIYLADGQFLLHGDYFPGSWLRGAAGVKVIDPEFGFAGPREFDLGVMLAHFVLGGAEDAIRAMASYYSFWSELDQRLIRNFAGIEILRRLLGVAQLPLTFNLGQKQRLVEEAFSMVLA